MGDAFIAPDAEETYYRQKESTAEGSNFKQLPVADFHYKESSTPWWVAILIIFPPAMIPFAKYHVELKDGELSFGYLLGFSRRVNVKDIVKHHLVYTVLTEAMMMRQYKSTVKRLVLVHMYTTHRQNAKVLKIIGNVNV